MTVATVGGLLALGALPASAMAADSVIVRPSADGTLVDGGVYGTFDGVADNMDWTFNQSSYEGAITLSTPGTGKKSEYRVVCEFNLSTVSLTTPVSAKLNVSLRGATVFPLPDAEVEVYSYPADLKETSADFSASPSQLAGTLVVQPFQPATVYVLDVSAAVSAAISSGAKKVAFRFQIKPNAQQTANQAFIDAIDSDVASKPYLTVGAPTAPLPGDFDNDQDADDNDYALFDACTTGPGMPYSAASLPAGCSLTPDGQGFIATDFDKDQDVDQTDFAVFQRCYAGSGIQVNAACAN